MILDSNSLQNKRRNGGGAMRDSPKKCGILKLPIRFPAVQKQSLPSQSGVVHCDVGIYRDAGLVVKGETLAPCRPVPPYFWRSSSSRSCGN